MPRNITITFADGSSHVYQNAPDDVTPDAVAARAAKDFNKPVKAIDGGRQPKKTVNDRASQSWLTTGINAVSRGATAGLDNVLAAGVTAPINYGLDRLRGKSPTLSGEFSKALGNLQGQDTANARANPGTNALAELAGGLMSPINKVGAGIKGAGLAARVGRVAVPAAVYGGVSGATNTQGNAMQRLKGAAEGAGMGLAGAGLGTAAGKVVGGMSRTLTPKFSGPVKSLLDRGVRLTPGQLAGGSAKSAEDKAMSFPGIGHMIKEARARGLADWNRAMYDRVLELIGLKAGGSQVGHEGIAQLETALGSAYDRLLPKLKFTNDAPFVNDVVGVLREARELPPDQLNQLNAIIDNRIAPRFGDSGTMDGKTFKQLESEIGEIGRRYRGSADAGQREMASRLNDLMTAMKSGLERSNPVYAPALKKLNTSWAAFTRIQNAAARRPTSNGLFTPADLLNAAKTMDRTVRKGSFARGGALMQKEARQAQSVLPSTVANSGTTDRALLAELALGGGATMLHSPMALAATVAGITPYTSPGMKLINAAARSTPGKTRNALAKLMQRAGQALPIAGGVAGAQLSNAGSQ